MTITVSRIRLAGAVLLTTAALLAGCSATSNSPEPSSGTPAAPTGDAGSQSNTGSDTDTPGVPDQDEQTSDTPSSPDESSTDTADTPAEETNESVVDALSITGPSDVPDVPDMRSAITDAAPQLPATITDATGKELTVTAADRVIALDLYGTLTDTIIGLGLQDRLVGRGASDTQDLLADLPVVSVEGIDLSVEGVLSLQPDLVLTNLTIGSEERYQQIEAAGVTVVRFDQVPSLSHLAQAIDDVGSVFGMHEAAMELADSVSAELAEARLEISQLKAATPTQPRGIVLYVRGTGGLFFIFGEGYGVSDILDELGLEDVAAEAGIEKLVPANPEVLTDLAPDIILTMRAGLETAGGVDELLQRPGLATTVAGQRERIVVASDSQLLSYGPRTPASLIAIARALYLDPAGT